MSVVAPPLCRSHFLRKSRFSSALIYTHALTLYLPVALSLTFSAHAIAPPGSVVDLVDFLKSHSDNEEIAVPVIGVFGCIGKLDCRLYTSAFPTLSSFDDLNYFR